MDVIEVVEEDFAIRLVGPYADEGDGVVDPYGEEVMLVGAGPIETLDLDVGGGTEHCEAFVLQGSCPEAVLHQVTIGGILAHGGILAFADDVDVGFECEDLFVFLSEFAVAIPTDDFHVD